MGIFSKVFGKKKEEVRTPKVEKVEPQSQPKRQVEVGDLLVAEPFFPNNVFDKAVIIVIASDDERVIGIITNKHNFKLLKEVQEEVNLEGVTVGLGGPVQNDKRVFALSSVEPVKASKEISKGIWVTDEIQQFSSTDTNTKFFAGFVAWKPEQLKEEIEDKMWVVKRQELDFPSLISPSAWDDFFPGFDFSLEHKIFPRIKANKGSEMYRDENADEKAINIPTDQQPISSNYTDDLVLCFVKEVGEHYMYLNQKFYNDYPSVTPQLLEKLAVNQLVEEVGEKIDVKGSPDDVLMITAGGNHEAAIVLMKDFMDYLQNQVEDELMLAIPAQDLLFVCKKNNAAAIEKMCGFVQQCFTKDDTKGLLSKGLYTRVMGSSRLEFVKQAF